MDEATGCSILKELFIQAGIAIRENYPLHEDAVSFSVDGFDPERRIGYEYITTAAGDRAELTPEVLAALEARMAQGGLYIFLIDERDVSGPDELRSAAARFLVHVHSLAGSVG